MLPLCWYLLIGYAVWTSLGCGCFVYAMSKKGQHEPLWLRFMLLPVIPVAFVVGLLQITELFDRRH